MCIRDRSGGRHQRRHHPDQGGSERQDRHLPQRRVGAAERSEPGRRGVGLMRKDLRWKVILVLVLTGICAWGVIPPKDKVRLGLDLKGGIHLAMRVESNDAVKAVLDT